MRNFMHAMIGVGVLSSFTATAVLAQSGADVAAGLKTQNQWLGSGSARAGWNSYLKTAALEAEIAKGDAADRRVLADVLARYDSGASGLERKQFAAVRQALAAWLGELTAATAAELDEAALAAKERFAEPPKDRLAAQKTRLRQALARLNSYLARGGADYQRRWRIFLELPALEAELAKNELPDPKVLDASVAQFFTNQEGVDLAPFADARHVLRSYTNEVVAASEKDLPGAVAARLDELAKRLAAFQESGSDADALAIGQSLAWLQGAGQSPELVYAVRHHYTQPNLFVSASKRLAAAGVKERVDDVSPVRELILGTDVHGRAHTVGNVSLRTVPSNDRATLEILMSGVSRSRNVGYNGPVTIYSSGLTNLNAYKRVYFDSEGLRPQPAVAVATTDTDITGVSAKLRIIEKMAWRRIDQSEAEAEVIASKRAERRLENRIDGRAADLIAKAQDAYQNKFRRPLLRRGEFPQQLTFSTTTDSLRIIALHANRARLGAPTPPPDLSDDFDLSVRVHESLVGNATEVALGGVTLTDERLAEIMKEATGEVPEELQITPDKDPWSITFSTERPVGAIFTGNTAKIAIHARRFTRGDQEIKRNIVISATYKLEQSGNGSKLTREGDVEVDYPDRKGALPISEVAFKTFIRRKFSSLFKEEIASDGLKLPGRWADIGKLPLRQLDADKGWLTLGWTMPDESPRTAAVAKK